MENRNMFWELSTPELPEYMNTYMEILKYSIPLIQNKIYFGRKLWEENKTILW